LRRRSLREAPGLDERAFYPLVEPRERGAVERGDGHGVVLERELSGARRRQQIAFVEDEEPGHVPEGERLDELVGRLEVDLERGIGGVDHLEEEVGVRRLLERRAERGEELLREIADEPDGVREYD